MVFVAVLARRLGLHDFGVFAFVQWLVEIASLVCSGGLPSAATRFFPSAVRKKPSQGRKFDRWFLRWGVATSTITGALAATGAGLFSGLTVAGICAVAFWAVAYAAWNLLGARVLGMAMFGRYAISAGAFVAMLLMGVTLAPPQVDLAMAIAIVGAANLCGAMCCVVRLRCNDIYSVEMSPPLDLQTISSYSTNMWFATLVSSFIWARGEISIVRAYLGESAVALYAAALMLASIVSQGMTLLTGGLWLRIATGWDLGQRDAIIRLCGAFTNMLILVASVSSGFVICFAPYLTQVTFGSAYDQSTSITLILVVGTMSLSCGCTHFVLQAGTGGTFAKYVTLIGAAVLLGGATVLTPSLGIAGAAVARCAAQLVVAGVTFAWTGRVIGHDADTRHNLWSFALAVGLASITGAALSAVPTLGMSARIGAFIIYSGLLYPCLPNRGWRSPEWLRAS